MPTVLRVGPYRLFFYSQDIEREDNRAKFWLPVRLQDSGGGFRGPELGRIGDVVREQRDILLGAWNDFFGA